MVRCGRVSATAWSNVRTVNGELREALLIEIAKNYREADSQWKKTHRFWPEDLPAVAAVAQRAYEELKVSEQWPAADLEANQNRSSKRRRDNERGVA